MKKINLLFAASLLVSAIFISEQIKAQPACAWAKKAGGTNEDFGIAVAADAFGNVYYLGGFYSQTTVFGSTTLHNQPFLAFNYGAEMFLVKYDSCGNFKWAKQAGGNSETQGRSIVTDATGNIYVSGYSNCDTVTFGTQKLINKYGYNIAFVVKYDANGNALWAKQASGYDNSVRSYAIAVDANNVYVTGTFSSAYIKIGSDSVKNEFAGGNESVFIAKFDNSGNIQWVRGGGGDYDSYGYGIGVDGLGNVYVGGTFGSSHIRFGNDSLPLSPSGYYDIFVVKYNSSGTEQWLRVAGADDNDQAKSLAADASGNVYITGFIGSLSTVTFGTHPITNTTQSLTMFIAKYDNAGTAQWAKVSQGDWYTDNQGFHVTLDAGGNPNVIGFYNSDSLKMGAVTLYNSSLLTGGSDTAFDIFVAKYKTNGNLSWARTAGGSDHDFGYGISAVHNSVYITGEFMSDSISFSGIKLTRTLGSLAGDGDAFIANNIATSTVVPDICMVTVDTVLSKHNIIVWDKTPFVNFADSFIIYREITTNVYKPIGAVPYSAMSFFTDIDSAQYFPNTGNPNTGTYRYKIALRDTSGNYSMMSPFHNTIYINNNSGTFTWSLYNIENSANPVTNYDLMRDDNSNGNWHTISSVAGSQFTVVDQNYSSFAATASWRVETGWSISCTPTIVKGPQTMSINLNSSRSNVFRVNGNGIQEYGNELEVQISPNPSSGEFQVAVGSSSGSEYKIKIYNVFGECIHQQIFKSTNQQIDLSSQPSGVYFLNVKTENGTAVKKIVKE